MRKDPLRIPKKYNSLIVEISREYGIPFEVLASLVQQESQFTKTGKHSTDPDSTAYGLTGMTAAAAKDVGMAASYNKSDRDNIVAGAKYLRARYDQSGDWNAAVHDYHNGPGSFSAGSTHPDAVTAYADEVMGRAGTRWQRRVGVEPQPTAPEPPQSASPTGGFLPASTRQDGGFLPASTQQYSGFLPGTPGPAPEPKSLANLPPLSPADNRQHYAAVAESTGLGQRTPTEILGSLEGLGGPSWSEPRAPHMLEQPEGIQTDDGGLSPSDWVDPFAHKVGPRMPAAASAGIELGATSAARAFGNKAGDLMDPIEKFAVGDHGGIHIGARAKDFLSENKGALLTAGISTAGGMLAGWAEDQEHEKTKGWLDEQAAFTGADIGQDLEAALGVATDRQPADVGAAIKRTGRASATTAAAKVGGADVQTAMMGLGQLNRMAASAKYQARSLERGREAMLGDQMARHGVRKSEVAQMDANFLGTQSRTGMAFDQQAGEVYTMAAGALSQLASLAFMDPYGGAISLAQGALSRGRS